MNRITILYLEIGLFKELYSKKIITEREMDLAVLELKKKLIREEGIQDEE